MSKLANPWKCDACGILRANDTNHWLILYILGIHTKPLAAGTPTAVCIEVWSNEQAEREDTKHACGVPCGLKLAAQLVMEAFFPAEIYSVANREGGKEADDAT